MEWKENTALADRLLGLIAEEMKLDKPEPHVTQLIYCLTKGWMDKYDPLPLTAKETCLFSIGVKMGEILLAPHAQEVEGELEGIHFSIDFVTEDSASGRSIEADRLGELKSTRMGTRKHPDDFPPGWHKQLLAYMKTAGSLHATYAIMYVIPAVFRTWEVSATQEEIDTNWTWLQARKVIYMEFIEAGTRPTPFEYNEPWECKNCRYKLICDLSLIAPGTGGNDEEDADRNEAGQG